MLLRFEIGAARRGLVVDEFSKRREDIPVAARQQAQTQIDVIERDREIDVVEAIGGEEYVSADRPACSRHRRDLTRQYQFAITACGIASRSAIQVTGNTTDTR